MSARTTAKRISIGIVIAAIVVAIGVLMVVRAGSRFADTYSVYSAATDRYITAAFKPAVESNPIRAEVNTLLARVLQERLTPVERFDLANRGIAHLNDIEGQIDDIKDEGDLVAPLIDELERSAKHPGNIRYRSDMLAIVQLGRDRAKLIADVRGLSYRANFYAGEVFERIIDDQGNLTPEHVRHLNDLIPQLEEQFDARAALYDELERNAKKEAQIARSLGLPTPDEE
jgi:hypothetical protein